MIDTTNMMRSGLIYQTKIPSHKCERNLGRGVKDGD